MKLNLVNIDEFCEDLPEVSFWKIFENRKFSKTGLFSQQIFGPLKSFHCACPKFSYKGPNYDKPKCPKCNVEIISCEFRKRRFGKIVLPFEILNPIFYYLITGSRNTVKKILDDIILYKEKYFIDEEEEVMVKVTDENREEAGEILEGLSGAIKYIGYLLDKNPDKPEHQYIRRNIEQITIRNIIVIPPDFRPCSKEIDNEIYRADDINAYYSRIIKISNELKSCNVRLDTHTDLYKTNFRYIQNLVFEIYDYVLTRMSKKKGLIRSNILGKRVDFSGRAVISPDPTLKLSEARIPYWMLLEILKPNLITHLINRRVCKRYNKACEIIDDCIKNKDPKLLSYVEEFCKDKLCMLNRQPTLHRMSVLAFKIRVHLGSTIQIHPMICPPLNADFDGDQMSLYIAITEAAEKDLETHVAIWNNLISPTDMTLVPQPNQDVILGIYTSTKN